MLGSFSCWSYVFGGVEVDSDQVEFVLVVGSVPTLQLGVAVFFGKLVWVDLCCGCFVDRVGCGDSVGVFLCGEVLPHGAECVERGGLTYYVAYVFYEVER